jgi:hypothetical protein
MISMNVTHTICQRPRRDNTFVATICAPLVGSLAVLAVVLRTVEACIGGRFGWHDACALGAGVWAMPFNAVGLLIGPAGFGRDVWTVPFENLAFIQKVRCPICDENLIDCKSDGLVYHEFLLAPYHTH